MREAIQNLSIAVGPDINLQITVSIGGAFAPQIPGSHASSWIDRADKELYRAKNAGRNRVCMDQPLLMEVSPEEKSQLFMDFSQNDSIWGDSLYSNSAYSLEAPSELNAPIDAALLERSDHGGTP